MKRVGTIAFWPPEGEPFQPGAQAGVRGHVDEAACVAALAPEIEEDGLRVRPGSVQHVCGRSIPDHDLVRVEWPYPPGPGAYPLTIVDLERVP